MAHSIFNLYFLSVVYALEEAQKKNWAVQTASQLLQTISQRIGEIKREKRNAYLQGKEQ